MIYRDYNDFYYLTDNSEFGYMTFYKEDLRDLVLSDSGAIFMSKLNYKPKSILTLTREIAKEFDISFPNQIFDDVLEFFSKLSESGYIVSGSTFAECLKNDKIFRTITPPENDQSLIEFKSFATKDDFFDMKFKSKKQLRSVLLEITSTCNERCVHCYIPHDDKILSLNYQKISSVLNQLRDMNVLNITITGGEPMMHKDFLKIVKKCINYNFSINILSNLTLMTDDFLSLIKGNPLINVQTSLYAINDNIHDLITMQKGSCKKTKEGIERLIQNGTFVQVNCPILTINKKEYKNVENWCKERNVSVSSDYMIFGDYNTTLTNLKCRLPFNEAINIEADKICNDLNHVAEINERIKMNRCKTCKDPICFVCQESFCISSKGTVFPCSGWNDYVLGDINKNSISDIWYNSKRINILRSLTLKDFPKCYKCDDREFCSICLMKNYNESKNKSIFEQNEYYCKSIHFIKELYKEKYFKK